MARVLCVGNAVLDLVFSVHHHPAEDEELRAAGLHIGAGGNAANTARVLRALGHEVSLGAVLADHPSGAPLTEELLGAGIDLSPSRRVPGMPPLSAVMVPLGSAHRAIVHHRATPEYGLEELSRLDLARWDWAHFESRPGDGTPRMIRLARRTRPDLMLSIEAEKVRPGAEEAFPEARLVLFSRGYAEATGFGRPEPFLAAMRGRVPGTLLTAAWGAEGAWGIEPDGTLCHAPAMPPRRFVDALGAGDTFNAGMIDGLAAGASLERALAGACALAGRKVGQVGFAGL